jgi:hypothetical protein
MKKRLLITSCLLVTLTLVLCLDVSAQQNPVPEKSKNSVSLEKSLDQLGEGLRDSVAIDVRLSYVRRTYVRLKERGGCEISFQVSQVPGSPYANQGYKPGPDLSSAEWRVNLSDLNVAEVKIETPAKGDYRVVSFATAGGKESIKWKGFGVGDVRWVSGGRIDISEGHAPKVAAALEQAIIACRE